MWHDQTVVDLHFHVYINDSNKVLIDFHKTNKKANNN